MSPYYGGLSSLFVFSLFGVIIKTVDMRVQLPFYTHFYTGYFKPLSKCHTFFHLRFLVLHVNPPPYSRLKILCLLEFNNVLILSTNALLCMFGVPLVFSF